MADFSKLFHISSKDHTRGRMLNVPRNLEEWPKEWTTIYYKSYARLPSIALSDSHRAADFYDLIKKRKSERDLDKKPADLKRISTILKYSCGITGTKSHGQSRAQASGGGRFPIEVYPLVLRGSPELRSGLYHYNVREHALDVIWQRTFGEREIEELFTYEWVKGASAVFLMTGMFYRTQMKYGERGYRYVLLEAGHIGQNIYLNAAALNLKCCALPGTRDQNVEKLLDIDGVTESIVYSVAIG